MFEDVEEVIGLYVAGRKLLALATCGATLEARGRIRDRGELISASRGTVKAIKYAAKAARTAAKATKLLEVNVDIRYQTD